MKKSELRKLIREEIEKLNEKNIAQARNVNLKGLKAKDLHYFGASGPEDLFKKNIRDFTHGALKPNIPNKPLEWYTDSTFKHPQRGEVKFRGVAYVYVDNNHIVDIYMFRDSQGRGLVANILDANKIFNSVVNEK